MTVGVVEELGLHQMYDALDGARGLGAVQEQLMKSMWRSAVGVSTTSPAGGTRGEMRTDIFREPGPYFNKQYQYYQLHFFQAVPDELAQWSKHWLGYSSYDGIALSGALLDAAPRDVQVAVNSFATG